MWCNSRAVPRYRYLLFLSRNHNFRKIVIILYVKFGLWHIYIYIYIYIYMPYSCTYNPFATWYYKEMVGQHQVAAALSLGKTRYFMYCSFWASEQTWTAWKITPRPGFGPRNIQSLASRMAVCGRVKKLQVDLIDILDTILCRLEWFFEYCLYRLDWYLNSLLCRLDWYFDTIQCRLHWFFEHCPILTTDISIPSDEDVTVPLNAVLYRLYCYLNTVLCTFYWFFEHCLI